MGPLVRSLYGELGIARGPVTPPGVVARAVDGRTLYVNTNNAPATVVVAGSKRDVQTGTVYPGKIDMAPYGVALVQ